MGEFLKWIHRVSIATCRKFSNEDIELLFEQLKCLDSNIRFKCQEEYLNSENPPKNIERWIKNRAREIAYVSCKTHTPFENGVSADGEISASQHHLFWKTIRLAMDIMKKNDYMQWVEKYNSAFLAMSGGALDNFLSESYKQIIEMKNYMVKEKTADNYWDK